MGFADRAATARPDPFGHQYEGHDLRLAGMEVIWSVGKTPEEAIEAFCRERLGSGTTSTSVTLLEGGDPAYTWGRRFTCAGTYFKAAGIHVPGGVILTWWK